MITLIVDFDEEIDFWFFIVQDEDKMLYFRLGFRTKEEADLAGDEWIRRELGGKSSSNEILH